MTKTKKYKIYYSFEGEGDVIVEAKNKEEAIEKYYLGDYDVKNEKESGQNYDIQEVEEIEETKK